MHFHIGIKYMKMHIVNQNYDVSLAKEFQYHLTKEHSNNGVFDQGKKINDSWKETVSCSG